MTCKNCKNRCDCKEKEAFERLLSLGDADCSGYEPDTMPDKLTDKKYSRTYNPCDDCSYSFSENNQESSVCKICEFGESLNLINRQKAEIERLRQTYPHNRYPVCVKVRNGEIYTHTLDDYDWLIGDISAEAVKEFAERSEKEIFIKQDNARKQMLEILKTYRGTTNYSDTERATDNLLRGYGEAVQDVLGVFNNLLKELVGDGSGKM